MTTVSEAVILMAGEGSRLRQGYVGQARLRGSDNTFLKPFVPLLGRPLISYALDTLIRAGIKTVNFVVGYESGRMIEQVKQFLPSGLSASFIENRDWQKQNGISLLAAAGHVSKPFLLTMSDHLFDDAVVDRLLDSFDSDFLNIAVDRETRFHLRFGRRDESPNTAEIESPISGKNCAITMPLISGCLFAHSKSSTISNERSPAAARVIAASLMEFG